MYRLVRGGFSKGDWEVISVLEVEWKKYFMKEKGVFCSKYYGEVELDEDWELKIRFGNILFIGVFDKV